MTLLLISCPWWMLILVVFACCSWLIRGATYTIRSLNAPNSCYGGDICIVQPAIAVLDSQGRFVLNFVGSVYVNMGASPSGFEPLYVGRCDYTGCGKRVSGPSAKATFVNGIATFSDLSIKTAGSGYTLKFVGLNSQGAAFAMTESSSFSVEVGPQYKQSFVTFIGSAKGGLPFSPNPVIGITDRGDNVIVGVNHGTVTAVLTKSPKGTEVLLPKNQRISKIRNGLAVFQQLYINAAGFPYQVTFNTSLQLPLLESGEFAVSVGAPARLDFYNGTKIQSSPVLAGEYFRVVPTIRILDAGGNLVDYDSSSGIQMAILDNPSRATLSPFSNTFSVAKNGYVTFSSLSLDKVGTGFRLSYTLHLYSSLLGQFQATTITLATEKFNVILGPPRALGSNIVASGAWAGGSSFDVQPRLMLLDFGGNVISTDFSTQVKSSMVESMSVKKAIKIDTSSTSVSTHITSVTVNVGNGTYGAGQVIHMSLHTNYEVWLIGNDVPFLTLDVTTSSGVRPTASFVGSSANTSVTSQVKVLTFEYIVSPGDSTSHFDYYGSAALSLNNTLIIDGNNRSLVTTLPSPGIRTSYSIAIDTTKPYIVSVDSTTKSGEYGQGQEIDFAVTFNYEVIVVGQPLFNVTVVRTKPSVGSYGVAIYNAVRSTASTLIFTYLVGQYDYSSDLTILSPNIVLPLSSSIKRKSQNPITTANLSFANFSTHFQSTHQIVIDTTPPYLNTTYGVQSSHKSGTFYPGETIMISIKFTKPIVTQGSSINLQLVTGPGGQIGVASIVGVGSDSKTVTFLYKVTELTNTTNLDISPNGAALVVPPASCFIKRQSTNPTMNANISTYGIYYTTIHTLRSAQIALYGYSPTVVSAKVVGAYPNVINLYPDNVVSIEVQFSAPVLATCKPVLVINAQYLREAVYVGGNNSNIFLFHYTIQTGDNSDAIYYRDEPTALCVESGCPAESTCTILANSSSPSLSAFLQMPTKGSIPSKGVRIGNQTVHPTPVGRNTTISSIKTLLSPGTYGAGTVVVFEVTFADEVLYYNPAGVGTTPVYPRLYLNIGQYAEFTSGFGSKVLKFTYITTVNDTIHELLPANIPLQSPATPISCFNYHCDLKNRVGVRVDATLTNNNKPSSNVTLDPTPPYIKQVYSHKQTSPYDGIYTTGELIVIYAVYSQPVLITGKDPRLIVDVRSDGIHRYATYDSTASTGNVLAFNYVVMSGDNTHNLAVEGPSLDTNFGQSKLFRQATIPTTEANYSLPSILIVAQAPNVITIDTTTIPTVLQVVAVSPPGVYATGDTVYLRADLSNYVILTGHAFISMNMGNHISKATFIGCNSTSASNFSVRTTPYLPTLPTKTLYFSFTVASGDFSPDVDYVDQDSFNLGVTDLNAPGQLLQASTNPVVAVDLDLPIPGSKGSVSYGSRNIYVDGGTAYLTSISFVNPPGIYGSGSAIHIEMNFTMPVIVTGTPLLHLAAGPRPRVASYKSGSNSKSIIFEYIVQPGDSTPLLDYAVNRAKLSSSKEAYDLNGGHIYVASAIPSVEVPVLLNSPGGILSGTLSVLANAGFATYLDLSIRQRGPDYTIRFSCEPIGANRVLTTTQEVFVSFSNEFEIRPDGALPKDFVGNAVAIENDLAIIGASQSNMSVNTIQTVSTHGAAHAPVAEVQIIRTDVKPQPGIQSFHTSADAHEIVGGYFRIKYGTFGPTRLIPVNVDPNMLHAILMYDLPVLGSVNITRENYIFCACENAFTWTLTFSDITEGAMEPLSFDYSAMVGNGATVQGPVRIQEPARLQGSFTLKTSTGRESSDVPFDADANTLQNALIELGLRASNIEIGSADKRLCRSWTVTFEADNHFYEIPLLQSNTSKLAGGANTSVWHEILRLGIHGPDGITGDFMLEFRGEKTVPLSSTSTALQVKDALEALGSIDSVHVTRSLPSSINEYTWTIEFIGVRYNTTRGWMSDPTAKNIEPLLVHSHLIGTNTSITVDSKWGMGQANSIYGAARQGTFGFKAGAVYVYQRLGESWEQVSKLVGNDTNEFDQFGSSVAIYDGNSILIGAKGADYVGLPDKQSIFCSASSGYFYIKFRGWTSNPISANVSRVELLNALVSDPKYFNKLHSINAVKIDDWGPGPLCNNNTAVITFLAPVDGDAQLLGSDTGANLEPLTLDNSGLTMSNGARGVLHVTQTQAGTWRPNNANSDTQQQGSAYLFRASFDCPANITACLKNKWTLEAQFFPLNPTGFENFGSSVALSDVLAVVGSPGSRYGKGSVYVYVYNPIKSSWMMQQEIYIAELVAGDNFGHKVAVQGNTLISCAPNANGGQGGTYVYKRPASGGNFIAVQTLLPPRNIYPLMQGDIYGTSFSFDDNILVVGAPGRDDSTIYFGTTKQPATSNTGAVFVFSRPSPEFDFTFYQKLTPSNVRRNDRFGWDVAIQGSKIVASAVENYIGDLLPSKAIVEVRTQAMYNPIAFTPLGNSFQLKWLVVSDNTITSKAGTKVYQETRNIPHDATAAILKNILEEDLQTGPLLVSRSAKDMVDGGYSWLITFVGQTGSVSLFEPDITYLTGTNASVIVRFASPVPSTLRGNTHVFARLLPTALNPTPPFIEQAFLAPFSFQPVDLCGYSVAISGDYVVVGCPNRDGAVPNTNSGAVVAYYLNLFHIQFNSYAYTVSEGNSLDLVINRRAGEASADILFYIQSVDRNAPESLQKFLRNLYGVPLGSVPATETIVDHIGFGGTAMGRSQYYGSTHNESAWVDGMYDYRAISDYVPVDAPLAFLSEDSSLVQKIITTADTILERPDETLVISINSPGIWPSILGELCTTITIKDNGDGYTSGGAQYDKLYYSGNSLPSASIQLGHVVSACEEIQVVASGLPLAPSNGNPSLKNAGSVAIYSKFAATTTWRQEVTLFSPTPIENGYFGDSLIIRKIPHQDIALLAVGEPGANKVHVYVSRNVPYYTPGSPTYSPSSMPSLFPTAVPTASPTRPPGGPAPNATVPTIRPSSTPTSSPSASPSPLGHTWTLGKTLSVPEAYLDQHRFGAFGTLGMYGRMLVVGAPGLEAIYVFKWKYSSVTKQWDWSNGERLRSPDFDEDIILSNVHMHRQEFGKSVALSSRMIVVGSPFADYNKLGTNLVEIDWDTEGTDIFGYGRGRAYTFYSEPSELQIHLSAQQQLSTGEFVLSYNNYDIIDTTVTLPFSATASMVRDALIALTNIDDVSVTANSGPVSGGYSYSWTVAFVLDWVEPGIMTPLWKYFGCSSCAAFDANSTIPSKQIIVTKTKSMTNLTYHSTIEASDKHNGNKFGWSVDIDGDQIVVGAIHSATASRTSWDFESGTLTGWSQTGNAFAHQPTYGDNSYLRAVDASKNTVLGLKPNGQRSHLRGNYYIGTYEKRPGNPLDYAYPDPNYPQGGFQGDEPVGTLTSDVFTIRGTTISFLIGGGCDYFLEYVELLVDGLSAFKETGRCSERMHNASFNVTGLQNRAAQIRIVDASSGNWGHINVDEFNFDWEVNGATFVDVNNKNVSGGLIETPRSGAVYAYHLHTKNSNDLCNGIKTSCVWSEEAKFVASDKRANTFFGSSVSLNDTAGVLVVGSPNSAFTGFYKEVPKAYPFVDSMGNSDASNLHFPVSMNHSILFQSSHRLAPEASGAYGVWYLMNEEHLTGDASMYENGGAVYIFTKDHVVIDSNGHVSIPQHWYPTEHAKLQPPDEFARDFFGSSVSISGMTIAVGATGQDLMAHDAGAVYVYSAMFSALSFSSLEYYALEGTDAVGTVTILRNPQIYEGDVYIAYATSDLSAKGVDMDKFNACLLLPTDKRGPAVCGDYQQTRGVLFIPAGSNSGGFQVPIMNDLCNERFMKYIQITISVPGSAALQGQAMSATLRIDDDDYTQAVCAWTTQ